MGGYGMKRSRYTVGEMANLCNVTAKQLRYYDQQGLLKPAYRDRQNGYRYYEDSQIEEVLLLSSLKELDLPNQRIGALLKKRDLRTLSRELEEHLYEVRQARDATVAKYDALIDNILRIMGGLSFLESRQAAAEPSVSVVEFPAAWVAYTRYQCYWKASRLFISRRAELLKLMDQAGLEPVDVNMAIFHSDYKKQFSEDPSDDEGDLEVCYRIKNPNPQLPNCRRLPAFRAVSCIYVGPYSEMLPAYLSLEAYAQRHGLLLRGISMEEYLIGATMTANPQNYVTRTYLPIAEEGEETQPPPR